MLAIAAKLGRIVILVLSGAHVGRDHKFRERSDRICSFTLHVYSSRATRHVTFIKRASMHAKVRPEANTNKEQ
eukprot:858193-Amphidinium_carterae.1